MAILYERPVKYLARLMRKILDEDPERKAKVEKLKVVPLKKKKFSSKNKKRSIVR